MNDGSPRLDVPPHYEPLRGDVGFSELAGPLYVRKPKDGQTLAWAFRAEPKHLNRGGVVHGGMLMTFADHMLGSVVYFAAGKKPCSTIQLDVSFVAPGRPGDWIECSGEVVRTTSSLIFVRGQVTAGDRTLADCKGIWKVLDRWLGEPRKSA